MVAPLALLGLSVAGDIVSGLIGGATSGQKAAAPDKNAKLHKTADDFESMFLEQAFDRITQNTGQDGPLGEGGTGGSVYRSMLMKEYAGQVTKSGGVGIADQVYRQMLQLQEGASRG